MKQKLFHGHVSLPVGTLKKLSQHNEAARQSKHKNCYFVRTFGRPSPNVVLRFFDENDHKMIAAPGDYRLRVYLKQYDHECVYEFVFHRRKVAPVLQLAIELKSPDVDRIKHAHFHLSSDVHQAQNQKTYINFYVETI